MDTKIISRNKIFDNENLMFTILSFLDQNLLQRINIRQVNTKLKILLDKPVFNRSLYITPESTSCLQYISTLSGLQKLDLYDCKNIKECDLQTLSNLTHLEKLILYRHYGPGNNYITNDSLIYLTPLINLKIIKLRLNISMQGIIYLLKLPKLKALINDICTNNYELSMYSHIKQLEVLKLSHIKITNFSSLIMLTQLSILSLEYCSTLTDDQLQHLFELTRLEKLSLCSCDQITDDGLLYLSSLTNLIHLNLSSTNIIGHGLEYISHLTLLNKLDLSVDNIDGDYFKYLSPLTNLIKLILRNCQSLKSGLQYLTHLPIQDLILDDSHITTIQPIFNFAQLRYLDLDCVIPIHNEKYKFNLHKLRVLASSYESLQYFEHNDLTNLERLWISIKNKISQDEILKLKGLNNLNTLSLNITNMDGKCLNMLSNLDINYFSLNECDIDTERLIDVIYNMTNLQHLTIDTMPLITDDLLKFVSNNLTKLNYISLTNLDAITDNGIKYLTKLNNLDRIYIDGCNIVKKNFSHLFNFNVIINTN